MESPQVTTDTASSPQPERQWVWRATLESRAAGKVSVLACVETVLAVVLYWWIAIRWDTHWHLVTSVFVAPLLLLRSPESIAAGVRWFVRDGFDSYDGWPKAKQRAWLWTAAIVSAVVAYFFARWLRGVWMLESKSGFALFGYSVLVGASSVAVAVAVAVALAGAFVGEFATAVALAGVFATAVALAGAFATAVALAGAGALVGFVPGLFFGFPAGVSLRAMVCRIGATLRYGDRGLACLPSNWRENNLHTDVCIPAELLPGIREEQSNFALDGWFALIRREGTGWRVVFASFAPFLFLPAFLYRLNIKATAWFWWPLAFLLRPVKQPTVEEDQKEALCWPWTNPFQKLLFVGISLLAMAVLFVRHVDPVRWSRLSKVEGVWTPVKALLALDWSHFPPWHWAIFVSAVCGLGMLALAGGAVSCAANKKWPPPGLGWKVKAMESLVRVRSLATVALLLFSLGALFIAHTPWHAHVPLPASWYSAMKHFYRVSEPEAKR